MNITIVKDSSKDYSKELKSLKRYLKSKATHMKRLQKKIQKHSLKSEVSLEEEEAQLRNVKEMHELITSLYNQYSEKTQFLKTTENSK